jgi:hypothetical protein
MRQLARLPHRRFATHKRLVGVTQKQQNPANYGRSYRLGVGTGVPEQLGVGRQIVAADHLLQTGTRQLQLSPVRVCQTACEIPEDQADCVTMRTAELQEILDNG